MYSFIDKIKKPLLPLLILGITLFGCKEEEKEPPTQKTEGCPSPNPIEITDREFKMGFSTWSYGPEAADVDATYQFISENADIYSEQVDHKIPWDAWINGTDLPSAFVNDITHRVAKKPEGLELVLSVSLLNTGRTDLLEDFDGSIPEYESLADQTIEDAYFEHLSYLVDKFAPDYLVLAMEVNELKIHAPAKWQQYQSLMANIRSRMKTAFPDLPMSESVTLHNWFHPEVENPMQFVGEISSYINENLDFAAISFYPFFKGLKSGEEFRRPFGFLKNELTIPIAFVETNHLAEDLVVEGLNTNIPSDTCQQKAYLETLLRNAHDPGFEFVIWWAHRDYDKLWETFPEEVKDVGKLWRDTGLLDEDGNERPAYRLWSDIFEK